MNKARPKQIELFFEDFHTHFRPPTIPEDWPVFNAARPIYASNLPESTALADWYGEFKRGAFYAAVDPLDPLYNTLIERNNELDASMCQWVTRAQVYYWIAGYYTNQIGVDKMLELLDNLNTTWDAFFEEHYGDFCMKYREWAKEFYEKVIYKASNNG